MSVPNAAQMALLRSRPHASKLYLSVYQPTTALACRLNNGSATKGDRDIPYDGVTSGASSLIRGGMSMFVGSSAGAFDKGVVRVKGVTGSFLYVAENSHINWADNDYLTVVNLYEINAVYPRMIQDPADAEATIWYKDYDIEYTNQNTVLGSFICMGSHYAGFVGDDVYYSASGTFNLKGESLSYNWFFEGATVTGSTSHTPGNRTYNTPGHYTTRLIVSGTASADVSYRHISIYNRPASGSSVPILRWQLDDLSGGRDQAGYTARIKVFENINETKLKDGSLVIIFSDDWYGDLATRQSLGGNSLGRSTILFMGYILQGSIKYNYRDSEIEFEAGSPTEIMKQAEGFGISVQHNNDPATATNDPNIPSKWVAILDMDLRRAIYHYLRWHSTVLLTNDFHFKGTDRAIQYFDADRTSIYDAVNTLMEGAFVGSIVCDRQGAVWAERSIVVESTAYETNMEVTKLDWIGDITIEERRMDRTSFIEMGGIAFSGATGTYAPYLTNAPGVAPGYRGSVERMQGLALISQEELNTIAGNLYAFRNSEYPNITINMAGNYRNFDIAPQEKLPLSIAATDSVRGITFTSKNFFINRLQWYYNPAQEMLRPTLNVAELPTNAFAGDSVAIPPVPAIEAGGFNIPTINVPQIVIPAMPTIYINTGGQGSPLFVPALGGNFNGEAIEDDLVFGGGPFFGGGLYPTTQAAISLNSGFGFGYKHEFNDVEGMFLAPASTFTIKALFYMYKTGGQTGNGTFQFNGGLDGISSLSVLRGGAAYGYESLTYALNIGWKYKSLTTLSFTESFTVGDVVRIWLETYNSTLDAYVYFYGWLLEW